MHLPSSTASLVVLMAAAVLLAAAPPRTARAQQVRLPVEDVGTVRDTLDAARPGPHRLRPFVMPGSVALYRDGARLDSTAFRVDHRRGRLWLASDTLSAGRIVAVYRTFPFQFEDVYRRRRVDAGAADSAGRVAVVEEGRGPAPGDVFGGSRLQHSGSISRGILAGNRQDVTLESGLRMQLSGEVVDGVDVQAVLTDENTPILPEGTTQRLEEFDRVFIEIAAPAGTARLGDFDLAFGGTEFARFSRKLQGVSLQSDLSAAGPALAGGHVAVAGATSRGTYRQQQIEPLDGVQGPYRLEGAAGERFILVVPGSEVVYLDGQRLTRGETHDYVIDYATAEVTFTAERIVTADQRITVEFQYTTNEFTRTLVGTQADVQLWSRPDGSARGRFGATFLREADGRRFTEAFGLTAADSLLLSSGGDGDVRSDGAVRVEFDAEARYTQYRREERVLAGGSVDTAYVALTAAPPLDEPVYRVRFSRVGEGLGRYAREGQSVNGIVYVYRGPGQGAYEPVRLLPKPKRQQLLDLHGSVEVVPGLEAFGEWARSLHDENRLSPRDALDDVGDAYLAGLRLRPVTLHAAGVSLGRLSAELRRRSTGAHFTSFDRIREVEFGRRWNLVDREVDPTAGVLGGGAETIDEGHVRLDVTPRTHVVAELGRLALERAFDGRRSAATLTVAEGGLPQLDYRLEHVASRDALVAEDGAWLRQVGRLQHPLQLGRLVPSLEVEQERRLLRVAGTDSLAPRSYASVEVRPGVDWTTETLEAGGHVELRTEDLWADGALHDAATAWTARTRLRYRPGPAFDTDAGVGYRLRRYTERFRLDAGRENNESLLLRWHTRLQPWERALAVDTRYEAQTERTPRLQEIYVRTGPELGQFVWEDANGNGVVEIEEMVPERTPHEGSYYKTFVPSDTLVGVVHVQARLRVQLDPARLWEDAPGGWRRWLSHITTRTTVDLQEKTRDPDLLRVYLLDPGHLRDPRHTLSGRLRLAQDVYLFQRESAYGLDVSVSQLRGLNQMAADEERRRYGLWRVEGRYKPSTRWGLRFVSAVERNRVLSDRFASRRYDIAGFRLEPEVSFHAARAVQLQAGVALARKRDALRQQTVRVARLPLEARFSKVRRLQVTARGEVAHVRLGVPDEALAGLARFELTDGRGTGTSYLWNLGGRYNLNQYLRATFSYDGRAPSDAPVIHTLRLELSALF